jgi:hypothetical protein
LTKANSGDQAASPIHAFPQGDQKDVEMMLFESLSSLNEELAIVGLSMKKEDSDVGTVEIGQPHRLYLYCCGESAPRAGRRALLTVATDAIHVFLESQSGDEAPIELASVSSLTVDKICDFLLSIAEVLADRREVVAP